MDQPHHRPAAGPPGDDLEQAWRDHRRYLLGLATRMLGDRSGAEDVVQDAYGRLVRAPRHEIQDVRGWLSVVVRRLSLNRLRSAYARREAASGAAPPEAGPGWAGPALAGPGRDPADRVTLDDQVRRALAIVLDRLTPAERTAFLLHDVFGFPFDSVASIVGRTPAACRQLASRARRAAQAAGDTATGDVTPSADAVVVERFIAACAGGELGELLAVLDPDVVGEARGFGRRQGHARGARAVGAGLMRYLGPRAGRALAPVPIEDTPGVVVLDDGVVTAVLRLDTTTSPAGTVVSHVLAVSIADSAADQGRQDP